MGRLLKGLCEEVGTLPESEARCYSANPANSDAAQLPISESSKLATKHDSEGNRLPAVSMRDDLLTLADAAGIDRAHVNALAADDVTACAGLDGDQLTGFLMMARDTAERRAGRAPAGDTATMFCVRCGPVFIHPDIAACLPIVGGLPRGLGCPWCHVRAAGGFIPRPKITCEGCVHYIPDTVNPVSGMGGCGKGHGTHYPMQQHRCADFRPGEVKP